MSTLTPEQVESVLRRLDFLGVETSDLVGFRDMTQTEYMEDRDRRRSLERLAENVVNTINDIAKIVLSAQDLPVPDTYRDAIIQLATADIVDRPLVDHLVQLVRLRNILAHQYLDIRWTSLRSFIDEAPAIIGQFETSIRVLLPAP